MKRSVRILLCLLSLILLAGCTKNNGNPIDSGTESSRTGYTEEETEPSGDPEGSSTLTIYPEFDARIQRDYLYSVSITQGEKTASLPVYNHVEASRTTRSNVDTTADAYRRFSTFAFDPAGGGVRVDIRVNSDFESYSVIPSAKAFRNEFYRGVISVYLDKPDYFMIRLNGKDSTLLAVFADEPETEIPKLGVNTIIIDGWHEVDGGVLELKKPGTTLYIKPGAVLNARVKITADDCRVIGRGAILDPYSDIYRYDEKNTEDYVLLYIRNADNVKVDGVHLLNSRCYNLVLNDLSGMQDMQIYEPWWGQKIREDSQFGGSSALWYAQSDISVTAFELTWCVAVNLDIVTNQNMEHPYTLVKENRWTMEKLFEMAEAGMSPNVDGSYEYREDTSCVMGFVTYNNFAMAGINGAGCFLTKKDDVGNPMFSGEGERFLDVVEQWAKAFHTTGLADEAQEDGYHYEDVFAKRRAFMAGVEIKATSKFRTAENHYGIVPVPKYNEEQTSYYSNVNYLAPLLVVPKTNVNSEKTGRILDTMAYLSYKDLLPVYYNSNLAYKALGTPEALEMLDIIRDTRCFETGLLYGWTTDFYTEVRDVFIGFTATTSPSGAITKYRGTIMQTLSDYISNLK